MTLIYLIQLSSIFAENKNKATSSYPQAPGEQLFWGPLSECGITRQTNPTLHREVCPLH